MNAKESDHEMPGTTELVEGQMESDSATAQAQVEKDKASLKAALEQAKADRDAKIAALQQQAAQATGEAKAKIEDLISQVRYENEEYAEGLNKAMADNTIVLGR